ncbi:hypothetical protein CEXT_398911 [Caerostris extrusa]|uniref:Uncharacterized protein n=1 Tax=Caerostris extrusa TaxID=172846 RepID=A0AAV4N059_CAEEX|nr:hypothetical protein CEXT_398911 [Caerostris extrusa]
MRKGFQNKRSFKIYIDDQNIYLKPGGKAAICFAMQSIFYDAMKEMENSKWRSYYRDVGDYLPDSHVNKRNASYYEQMINEVGFEILYLKEESTADVFSSDEVYKSNFYTFVLTISDDGQICIKICTNNSNQNRNQIFANTTI